MKEKEKWYKKPSDWIFVIACVILVPMLIVNLSIMFQAKKDENKVPSVFGYKPFMVLSGSMETKIRRGDLIITKIIDPETLKIGDVIAFRDAAGTVTTHRIIDMVEERGQTYFITKGDNNSSQDQNLVELNDVEGLYVGRIPGIGSIMNSLAEPTTIVILVLAVTAIFVITFSISNKKQSEQERKEYLEYKMRKEQEEKEKRNKKDQEMEEFLEYKRRKEQEEILENQGKNEKQEYSEYQKQQYQNRKEYSNRNGNRQNNNPRNNNYVRRDNFDSNRKNQQKYQKNNNYYNNRDKGEYKNYQNRQEERNRKDERYNDSQKKY